MTPWLSGLSHFPACGGTLPFMTECIKAEALGAGPRAKLNLKHTLGFDGSKPGLVYSKRIGVVQAQRSPHYSL